MLISFIGLVVTMFGCSYVSIWAYHFVLVWIDVSNLRMVNERNLEAMNIANNFDWDVFGIRSVCVGYAKVVVNSAIMVGFPMRTVR